MENRFPIPVNIIPDKIWHTNNKSIIVGYNYVSTISTKVVKTTESKTYRVLMLDLILIFGDLVNVSFLFLYSNELNQLDVF